MIVTRAADLDENPTRVFDVLRLIVCCWLHLSFCVIMAADSCTILLLNYVTNDLMK